ncbi:MAG: HAD family hydrolase [Opitutales bacterium]
MSKPTVDAPKELESPSSVSPASKRAAVGQVHSFDVFDTCLTRVFAQPSALFFALAREVLSKADHLPFKEDVSELARYRIRMEGKVRDRQVGREDIDLATIYKDMVRLPEWGVNAAQMMQAELALERRSLRPIHSTLRQINGLRQAGKRVIFISDMYLPAELIQSALEDHGFFHDGDGLYVSSEAGLLKATGRLYAHVCEAEGIVPAQLHHFGDNFESDFHSAKRMGVKATHFAGGDFNRYERRRIDWMPGEPETRSLFAGISRAVRLGGDESLYPSSGSLLSLAACVAGPLLADFIAWVLHDARSRGLDRLYFLSRDGQILFRMAQEMEGEKSGLELRYLHVSRNALKLPAYDSHSRKALAYFIESPKLTLGSVLDKLGFDNPEEGRALLLEHGYEAPGLDEVVCPGSKERLLDACDLPVLSERIIANARARRVNVLGYLRRERIFEPGDWAVVDVGWMLNMQRKFQSIVHFGGFEKPILGYHLGALDKRKNRVEAGGYRARYLQQYDKDLTPRNTRYLFKAQGIIEDFFFFANHGTVLGYKNEANLFDPVLKAYSATEEAECLREQFNETLLTYAREYGQWALDEAGRDASKAAALDNLVTFLRNPTRDEVRACIAVHKDEVSKLPMVVRLGPGLVLKRAFKKVRRRPQPHICTWAAGSVALSMAPFRWLSFFRRMLQDHGRHHPLARKALVAYLRFKP